jgi:hypothetical protein
MHLARMVRRVVLGAMLGAAIAGCSGSGRSAGEAESGEQLAIGQVGQILRVYQKGKKPAPKGVKELLIMEAGYPAAITSIRSKEVLVYWGVGFAEGPGATSTILAYHKDTPVKGGEVLMQDGTARKMTADEFKAARKPEGATTDPGSVPGTRKK